jgi:hypothetical protein
MVLINSSSDKQKNRFIINEEYMSDQQSNTDPHEDLSKAKLLFEVLKQHCDQLGRKLADEDSR